MSHKLAISRSAVPSTPECDRPLCLMRKGEPSRTSPTDPTTHLLQAFACVMNSPYKKMLQRSKFDELSSIYRKSSLRGWCSVALGPILRRPIPPPNPPCGCREANLSSSTSGGSALVQAVLEIMGDMSRLLYTVLYSSYCMLVFRCPGSDLGRTRAGHTARICLALGRSPSPSRGSSPVQ